MVGVSAALTATDSRAALVAAWRAAVAAVHGETVLRDRSRIDADHWYIDMPAGPLRVRLPDPAGDGRVRVIGAGKAAASLARGVEAVFGARLADGLVVVKHGHREPLSRLRQIEAGHPLPDDDSERAAAAVVEFLGTPHAQDLYLVLLTGGASALLAAPADGLSLDDKSQVTRLLVECGADIAQINVVRRHLSRIKGGRLAQALAPAASLTLAISDVDGDDPATIGSGPTVADPSTFAQALDVLGQYGLQHRVPRAALRHLQAGAAGAVAETPKPADPAFRSVRVAVIATLADALAAAAQQARAAGFEVFAFEPRLQGDTHARAREFASRLRELAASRPAGAAPRLLLGGGETTLQVRGSGRGGRCQEFAVVAAQELAGSAGLCVLVAGTDGTDGPTDAAGSFADGGTVARATAAGLDPAGSLRDNDSYRLLEASGDLFRSGPTGTNVTDLVLGVAGAAPGSPPGRSLA